MRNVPILDKEYMEQRARTRYWMEYMHALRGTLNAEPSAPKKPEEAVRDEYLSGAISVEIFEARLDVIFGLKS